MTDFTFAGNPVKAKMVIDHTQGLKKYGMKGYTTSTTDKGYDAVVESEVTYFNNFKNAAQASQYAQDVCRPKVIFLNLVKVLDTYTHTAGDKLTI